MKRKEECYCIAHEDVRSYWLWREKPKGTGESAVIIIPLDYEAEEAYNKNLSKLHKIFNSTTDSEESLGYRSQLDDIPECDYSKCAKKQIKSRK